jgi:hypothetical protein
MLQRRRSVSLRTHTRWSGCFALVRGCDYLLQVGKKYESGMHRVGDATLYVNRVLGMEPPPAPQIRFLAGRRSSFSTSARNRDCRHAAILFRTFT